MASRLRHIHDGGRHANGTVRGRLGHFFACCILLLTSTLAWAGRGDLTGTTSAPELLIPVGARAIGMGCSSLAIVDGIEALYWNPAGMVRSNSNTDLLISHMAYLADIGVDYLAFSTSLGDIGRLGLSVKSLSFGDIPVTTEDQPDGTGQFTSPTFLNVGGTFARHISDRITAGISSTIIYEKMADVSTSGIAFTAGAQYIGLGGIDALGLGVVIRNIGPSLTFGGSGLLHTGQVNDATRDQYTVLIDAASADLPSTIEIGLGYKLDVSTDAHFNFTMEFQNNNYSNDEYKLGSEYSFKNILFIRAGYMFSASGGDQEYIYGATAGIGVRTVINRLNIEVDYAYRATEYFDGNNVFAVELEF